ncbi:hypothetical protein EDD11_006917 [Mortierella claussenii]|nr:hypothetical protein EDD11_006917 [Mortierella claussenii]
MTTSTLQLMPAVLADNMAQLDPVAYDLKRLKVYSSCLRCRAKKVKCDRKEPCSRCEKHSVECSYREMASVQLDIRQFHRHLSNPKIRRDGAGIITATATPVIPTPVAVNGAAPSASGEVPAQHSSSASSPLLSTITTATSTTSSLSSSAIRGVHSSFVDNITVVTPSSTQPLRSTANASSHNDYGCPNPVACASGSFDIMDADTALTSGSRGVEHPRVSKVHRRRPSFKLSSSSSSTAKNDSSSIDRMVMAVKDISEHVDRVQLTESTTSTPSDSKRNTTGTCIDRGCENEGEQENDIPIWRAQAVGKHKQTAHEQDMAETFGLAAYLKAKEMEISQDPGRAGQTIDYEMELERALAQRMPSSFSRPDHRSSSYRIRSNKYAQPGGYNPATPYARPSHCQLSTTPNSHNHGSSSNQSNRVSPVSKGHAHLPTSAQCCCQIAAMQGQALGSCPYSNISHDGYDRASVAPALSSASSSTSGSSSSPQTVVLDHEEALRIAYSPSSSPKYHPREVQTSGLVTPTASYPLPSIKTSGWTTSSSTAFSLPSVTSPTSSSAYSSSSSSRMDLCSPTSARLPPIRLPAVSDSEASAHGYEVGRDGDETMPQIECKYNEPNVDAWDMIEKPISRTVPVTTKRGRSIKMEMGWILS